MSTLLQELIRIINDVKVAKVATVEKHGNDIKPCVSYCGILVLFDAKQGKRDKIRQIW